MVETLLGVLGVASWFVFLTCTLLAARALK